MQHIEQHFSGSDTVRDVVIGMADGLSGLAVAFDPAGKPCAGICAAYVVAGMNPAEKYQD